MSAVLTTILSTVAAPMVRSVLDKKLGAANADLAASVLDAIADRAGVSIGDLDRMAQSDPDRVARVVTDVEAAMPEMIQLYHASIDHQFALLQAEMEKPTWTWAWRPVWMYFLCFAWAWNIVLLHVLNALLKWALPPMDMTALLGVTSLFMALYMGGHTLKSALSKQGGAS